jgi:hypothetical protein
MSTLKNSSFVNFMCSKLLAVSGVRLKHVWALVVVTLVFWIGIVPTVLGQCPSLTWIFTGVAAGDHFGCSVSGAGDVNNDGYDDLIVGAYGNDAVVIDEGRAYVYSGQTGGVIYTFTGESTHDGLGGSVSGAGDVNNDGYDDLIVGAMGANDGYGRA